MGGLHIAEGLGIPYYRAFTMPWTRTRAYPHAFAVPSTKRGGAYNYMTYSAFDQVFWRATAGQINRFRRKVIGIEPTDFNKMEQHKVPFLYNFSASILPPPLDWYEWIHGGSQVIDCMRDLADVRPSHSHRLLVFGQG